MPSRPPQTPKTYDCPSEADPPDASVSEIQMVTRYRVQLVRSEESGVSTCLLERPDKAAQFFWQHVHDSPQEVMMAAFLDSHNRVIGWQKAFVGTLTRAAVEPRVILQAGLLSNAASIIVAHNHPSGDPAPSAEDLGWTRRMAAAGEILGLRLVDHLILGEEHRWVSLAQRGAW